MCAYCFVYMVVLWENVQEGFERDYKGLMKRGISEMGELSRGIDLLYTHKIFPCPLI